MLTRIDEVFDCWFESGSMPYAQQHYPFENEDKFLSTFPADFVAEGLDQVSRFFWQILISLLNFNFFCLLLFLYCFIIIKKTRGWFYTLMVLSTALFDKPAFKNLICNGLVLSEFFCLIIYFSFLTRCYEINSFNRFFQKISNCF